MEPAEKETPGPGVVDLRSDTVTRPTPGMRAAMAEARVGDDVYGEDPSVNRLEAEVAARLGKEAALFVASGTMGNLLALLAHCGRGDEYIAPRSAHLYCTEGGGGAALGGIQPQPLEAGPDGAIALEAIAAAIKPEDVHFARTRLLCLENTHAGRVLAPGHVEQAARLVRARGLSMHLDGARLFNAAVRLGEEPERLASPFDTVSVCLSKSLGAPVGSVLAGDGKTIGKARRWRKVVGGGMRQAGILAAAGSWALAHHVERLAEDHAHAELLAGGLEGIPGLAVVEEALRTNMVFVHVRPEAALDGLLAHLEARGVRVSRRNPLRLVTHLDVDRTGLERAIDAFRSWSAAPGPPPP